MRLFAALLPTAEVLDHLEAALRSVGAGVVTERSDAPVRWTARATWHLTAAFYGELPDGRVPDLSAELDRAASACGPFDLRLRGAGMFAHRTLWVGVSGDLPALTALTRGAVRAGDVAGARPDERVRSRAHLTVGRSTPSRAPRPRAGSRGASRDERARADDGIPEALVRALAVYEGPAWTVERLALVESVPGAGWGGRPLYTPVEEFALGSA